MTAPPGSQPFPRLARMAAQGRLPPSLLLSGPPGAPTREAALWLAAIANSPAGDPDTPATRRIAQRIRWTEAAQRDAEEAGLPPGEGPWPDLQTVHPDPKGEILVEPLRAAVERSRPHPFEGRRRFLVLVGADGMKNPQVANTLLKVLEEPPAHLVIILTAVREAALLPTILSRCQRWRFRGTAGAETADRLRREYGYSAADAAWAAAGGTGDLEKALALARERLPALAEQAVELASVVCRGIVPGALPPGWPASVLAGRARLSERLASGSRRTARGGGELGTLFAMLRAALRDLAALASGAEPLYGDPGGRLAPLAKEARGSDFAEAFRLVEEADRAIHRRNGNPRMQLDALLLAFNDIARRLFKERRARARARAKSGR